jgi:CubicO group peptidase (beta-lactamase class C family)
VIGPAYKAKVLCSLIFGSGRAIETLSPDEVSADSYWMMRLIQSRVDRNTHSVTAWLSGFRPRTAVFRNESGATLVPGGGFASSPLMPSPASAGASARAVQPWPTSKGSAALERAVDAAFLDPTPRRLRRTRAVLVALDGRILAERYAAGFSEATRFQGWSMTKSVLGALAGVLVGEGRLSLNDRALLPGWTEPDPRAAVTVEDLLRMRSGLAFSEQYADLSSDVIEMLFNQPDTAGYAASRPLVAAPGTSWSYSSGTTNILSAVLRRRLPESEYLSWPRRVLFEPLGMTSALMETDASGTFVASSFMLATTRDWARFGQLFLQDGVWQGTRLLPDGWVRYCTTPTPQSPDGIYGAHWWLGLQPEIGGGTAAAARLPRDAFFAVGHEGQTLTVIPSRRLVVARLGLSIYIDAWNHAAFVSDLLEAL